MRGRAGSDPAAREGLAALAATKACCCLRDGGSVEAGRGIRRRTELGILLHRQRMHAQRPLVQAEKVQARQTARKRDSAT